MSDKKLRSSRERRGMGTGVVEGLLKQGYNVVATSLNVGQSLIAALSALIVPGFRDQQGEIVRLFTGSERFDPRDNGLQQLRGAAFASCL
jgi:NAD(P)-dependent dehydrogenase (short-subunit alcohol dehydrogenase family)